MTEQELAAFDVFIINLAGWILIGSGMLCIVVTLFSSSRNEQVEHFLFGEITKIKSVIISMVPLITVGCLVVWLW